MAAVVARRCLVLGVIAASLATACGRSSAPRVAPPAAPRLAIQLYDGIGIHGYSYAELVRFLDTLDPATSLATITEADVERYRVYAATGGVDVVLSAPASARLRARRPAAAAIEDLFQEGPFLVLLDGQRLYGGLSYRAYGAAGLQHPVLHWTEEAPRLVLQVRPVQGPSAGTTDDRRRIAAPALEALFTAAGRVERVP